MGYAKVIYEDEPLIDLTADTVNSSSVLSGKTFHDYKGDVLEGTMQNIGTCDAAIDSKDFILFRPAGYAPSGVNISIASAEKAKIIAENIKKDVTILGVTGTHEGGSGTTYEEEDLDTGGYWAKINYIESPYPEVPAASERSMMYPYIESLSGKHCTVYAKDPVTKEWVTKAWNDTKADEFTTANISDEEFYYRINLKIVPDPGYKIDPTSLPLYQNYNHDNYGAIFAGLYPGYTGDTTGSWTCWAEIIDIDDDGNGYAAVCKTASTTASGNSIDIYCKAIPI